MNFPYMYESLFAGFVIIMVLLVYLTRPKYLRFKECMIYDVKWKWKWYDKKVQLLECYCPMCGSKLVLEDDGSISSKSLHNKITFFICKECGDVERGRIKGGDRTYAIDMARREIMRLVHTKEYLKMI